jgi:hypothetical protein
LLCCVLCQDDGSTSNNAVEDGHSGFMRAYSLNPTPR